MLSLSVFLVFLTVLKIVASNALVSEIRLSNIQNNSNSLPKCLSQVFKKKFPPKTILSVVSSNNHQKSLLQTLHTSYSFSVITRSFAKQNWSIYSDIYMISVQNLSDFTTGITELSTDLSWKPTVKFVIIFKNIRNNTNEVFKELLRRNILNVILIKPSKNRDLELLTYYPYSGTNCGQNVNDIRSFGYCRNLNNTPLFPNKIPNGLRNCTIRVAAREDVPNVVFENNNFTKFLGIGAEQYLLNIIAKYEGFNINYIYIDPTEGYGVVLPNNTVTGLVGYLQNDKANIIIGGLLILQNRIATFDFIYGYNYALFSIFTPVLPEQKWTRVYRQFGILTWMLIIVSFLFTTTVILMTKTLTSGKPKDKLMLILKLWRYFYGQVDDNLFRDKYLKRITIVWIIFTNSICAFYNTALYSLITGHVQEEIKIDLRNLASLPFKPCISKNLRTFFSYAYNETFPKGDSNPLCQDTDTAFEGVGGRTDLYTIDTDYAYFLRGSKYEDAEGRPKIKKWDYPRNLVFSIYMTKGFPLRHKFQTYALDIYEKGLLQRHLARVLAKKPKTVVALKKKYNPSVLKDFIIHFSILVIGSIISFISFLIELRVGN